MLLSRSNKALAQYHREFSGWYAACISLCSLWNGFGPKHRQYPVKSGPHQHAGYNCCVFSQRLPDPLHITLKLLHSSINFLSLLVPISLYIPSLCHPPSYTLPLPYRSVSVSISHFPRYTPFLHEKKYNCCYKEESPTPP
jgi:hypothetical protein